MPKKDNSIAKRLAKRAMNRLLRKGKKKLISALLTSKGMLVAVGVFLIFAMIGSIFGQFSVGGTISGKDYNEVTDEDVKLEEDLKELALKANYSNMYVYRKNGKFQEVGGWADKSNGELFDRFEREDGYMLNWSRFIVCNFLSL